MPGRAHAREADVSQLPPHLRKRALESGAQITWLSRHLGHATTKMTTDTYGHWELDERAKQAKLLEGAFGV